MVVGASRSYALHSPPSGGVAHVRYRGRIETDDGPLAMVDHPIRGFLAVPHEEVVCVQTVPVALQPGVGVAPS
jgi:hypothetical protein